MKRDWASPIMRSLGSLNASPLLSLLLKTGVNIVLSVANGVAVAVVVLMSSLLQLVPGGCLAAAAVDGGGCGCSHIVLAVYMNVVNVDDANGVANRKVPSKTGSFYHHLSAHVR